MMSTPLSALVRRAAVAAVVAMGAAVPALAQNSEGPVQVRVGAFLQGGGVHLNGTNATLTERGNLSNNGIGLSAGFELLRQNGWTFGVEVDGGNDFGSRKPVAGARFETDYFGNFRGRVGYYFRPDWVVYGTGGFGYRGLEIVDNTGAKVDKSLFGGVYGAGTEWHRGGTIFFAEYLHNNYGSVTATTPASLTLAGVGGQTFNAGGSSDAIRFGVKFKLGHDGYYDEVRGPPGK